MKMTGWIALIVAVVVIAGGIIWAPAIASACP